MLLASQQYDELVRCFPLVFEDGIRDSGLGTREGRIPEALAPWIGHLIELDGMAELLPAAGVQLNYDELRGLALLRAAKQKFIGDHERCHCGRVKRRGGFCPRGCAM